MSVNSSSSNDSLLLSNLSTINPELPYGMNCYLTRPSSLVYITFFIIRILLLLPLCILILCLSLQRWQQQCSTPTATVVNHSDSFSYHMIPLDLLGIFGCLLCCFGIFAEHGDMIFYGFSLWTFAWYGETVFHILTCGEHFLAVVHPVTYLSLKRERGIRIRNIIIGCVWLICFVGTGVVMLENVSLYTYLCVMIITVIIVSFFSLSVLRVLIRSGPGEPGSDRDRVQAKQRAFCTIMVVFVMLLLRFVWNVVWIYLNLSGHSCVALASGVFCNLPGSVVLPLLFLLRAGPLACCKNTK